MEQLVKTITDKSFEFYTNWLELSSEAAKEEAARAQEQHGFFDQLREFFNEVLTLAIFGAGALLIVYVGLGDCNSHPYADSTRMVVGMGAAFLSLVVGVKLGWGASAVVCVMELCLMFKMARPTFWKKERMNE
jgi:hypothetical protein